MRCDLLLLCILGNLLPTCGLISCLQITPVDLTSDMMREEWFGGEYAATTYDKVSRRYVTVLF